MLKAFRIDEPPPSVNRAWRKYRNTMVRSEEFKSWETLALIQINVQAAGWKLPDPYYFSTQIHVPKSKTKADLDNCFKAIHDALKKSGVTPDDRYLVKTSAAFWGGDYLLVYVRKERLSLWQSVMKTSNSLIQRMAKSGN